MLVGRIVDLVVPDVANAAAPIEKPQLVGKSVRSTVEHIDQHRAHVAPRDLQSSVPYLFVDDARSAAQPFKIPLQ
eukprot:9057724-Pyramimonas_sp.AAC.1